MGSSFVSCCSSRNKEAKNSYEEKNNNLKFNSPSKKSLSSQRTQDKTDSSSKKLK